MDLRETGWEGVDWIHLAQDRNLWQVLLNTVMKRIVFLDFIHRLVSQEQTKLRKNFVCSCDTRRWTKSKNTTRSILIHNRQNPTDIIYGNETLGSIKGGEFITN
jgi:hypothetical protein